ncbi:diguanylate cyclase [Shewanella sp. CG12_big_fil_rev_8_21_14_0_65_47_15]|uniref:diguanylate cyclase domain-containing protein n=1 Tax=Shewanella sp. CG12_big_fil_rev_8_21_14_0_65_47_15 TaxID=1975537 RepID=UPI000CA84959|nr:diguanylate cyclase [Shewanella sp. CG12_big_fil_rev_8_21_14_0_65_47_15]PIW60764.1 MAG: GGDEF domain-containing protein [Shewanella sp. CG12_big_fil_rev_8_21_14_0_65_47_15]
MLQTEQTLFEQMRITELEIEFRKALFSFTLADVKALLSFKPIIEENIDKIVDDFYGLQTSVSEIALLIGDSDTLARLRTAQRRYVLDLFNGVYDLEYVNNRLRIGLVHKRIGVEPKLYLSAVHTLKELIYAVINKVIQDDMQGQQIRVAIDKLVLFDVTLVFDTYIRSLVSEIENAKDKAEKYAQSMESKVKERTQQLEELSQTDPLTGLLNVRHLQETATRILRAAQRRAEPVSVIYLDVDDFKLFNDTQGHRSGDDVLCAVAQAIKESTRSEDYSFRYGGDEFCIIMPNCREVQALDNFVTRFNQKIKQSLRDISLSYGIVETGPYDYDDANSLIHKADQKMYSFKRASKLQQQNTVTANEIKPENTHQAEIHPIQPQVIKKAVE